MGSKKIENPDDIVECRALALVLFDDYPIGDGYRYYAPADFVSEIEQDGDGRSLRDLSEVFLGRRADVEMFVNAGLVEITGVSDQVLEAIPDAPVPGNFIGEIAAKFDIAPPASARVEVREDLVISDEQAIERLSSE